MAKPNVTADWATDANYPAGSEPEAGTPTKVAYTLGQEMVGWRPGARPPAQELNTWMHRVGLWIAYLNTSVWEDDLLITGELEVNGPAEFNAPLTAHDGILVDTAVESREYYVTDPVPMVIPAAAYRPKGPIPVFGVDRWTLGNQNDDVLTVPIVRNIGDRILGFSIRVFKQSDGDNTITVELVKYNASTGARSVIASDSNGDNAPGAIELQASGLTEKLQSALESYALEVTQSDDSPSGLDTVHSSVVVWDRPPPTLT